MRKLRRKLSRFSILKRMYYFLKRLFFEFQCVFYDLYNIPENYRMLRDRKFRDSDTVFICSLSFYKMKKWQVVSQADLWYEFVERNNLLICGSFVSYWLFGHYKAYVVSLEPKYSAPKIKFSKSHKKVFVFVSDSHSKSWLSKYIVSNNVTDILTPYKKTLLYTRFSSPLSENNVHSLPWCVSDRLLDDIEIKQKDNKVLGFGNTGGDVYDLRSWTFETGLLSSFNYAGSGNKKFSGDAYYRWLRSFDACVVAMSTHKLYNYTVAKYFEVPSQGLLLFAFETDDFDEYGFVDGENCIKINKQNFHEIIKSFKSNPEKYLKLRLAGYNLIRNNHTVSKRLGQLTKYISE